MKLIKYFDREIPKNALTYNGSEDLNEPELKIIPVQYKCNDEEFNYWLDVIKKTYSKFGEITIEDVKDIKTDKQIIIEALTKEKLNTMQKDKIILNLMKELVNVKMDLINLKKGGNK